MVTLKIYIQVTLYRLIIFRNICVHTYTYMYAITVSEKNGHKFEGEQGGIVWERWKGGKGSEKSCNDIINSKI